jgi:transposase
MPRSLKIRKPRPAEVRQLQVMLEEEISTRQRRRAEAIVLYAAGLEAVEIAHALGVHIKTIYSDRQAFDALGVACVREPLRGGAPARLSAEQLAEILRLAETPPGEVNLPFGRWSLAKLREYLIRRRVVKAISREHLRRVLKKGGCAFAVSSERSSAMTRDGARSWRGSATPGITCPAGGCCCFSTYSQSRSRPTAGGVLPRSRGLCWTKNRRRAGFSTSLPPTR